MDTRTVPGSGGGERLHFSGDRAFQSDLFAVDSTFFHFFSYQVVEGILALSRPDVAILTEKYARRLFGKESPIGKN